MKWKIFGGVALGALVIVASAGNAHADELTRPSCWTALFASEGKRVICFVASFNVRMTNFSYLDTDHSTYSTCKFSGRYERHGSKVTITVPPNSDKCSNGAISPTYSAECEFSGEDLVCSDVTIIAGKKYPSSFTAK